MNVQFMRRYGTIALIITLAINLIVPVFADSRHSFDKIHLNGSSYIELTDINMFHGTHGKTVSFTVTIHNGGSSNLSFIDYWIRLKNTSGAKYSVYLISEDKNKDKIPPYSSEKFTFYSIVNEKTQLNDLVFEFIKWDFSMPNYERKLGEIRLSNQYSMIVPKGSYKKLNIESFEIKTYIDQVKISEYDKNYKTTVNLIMENTGVRNIAIPKYNYYIRTQEGYMYEIELEKKEQISLKPKVEEEIKLKGEIPVIIDKKGWQLVITSNETQTNIELPVAYFELPEPSEGPDYEGVIIGEEQIVTVDDKRYGITLKSIQRLPWNDEDIIASEITIRNDDTNNVPLLDLTGYYKLDGVEMDETDMRVVNLDHIIGLPKGSETKIIMYTKVPYTYEYNDVELVIYENSNDPFESSTKDDPLITFKNTLQDLQLPVYAVDETHHINNIGKRAEISIRDVRTYNDVSTSIINVGVVMENLEKRQTELAKLTGYLKTEDDVYFPVQVSDYNTKISPRGKALISFSSKIPKRYQNEKMQLIIGEEISEGDTSAYIKGVVRELPLENIIKPKNEFENIEIYPYQISLSNMKIAISQHAKVTFDYELTKSNEFEVFPEGHKLVMELVDQETGYTQEFEFEKDLKIGKHQGEMIADLKIENLGLKIREIDGFEIRIYDSYQGHKKLLANKKIYFITTG